MPIPMMAEPQKTGGTFPKVNLGMGLTARIMEVTPDLAERWLKKNPRIQRNMGQPAVDMIARLIAGNDWHVNGATIVFGSDGRLYDGQHRLAACIRAGKPILCLCIWGVDPVAFETMDTGRARVGTDALRANKIPYVTAISAAVNILWRIERGTIGDLNNRVEKMSPLEISRFADQHHGLVDAASLAQPCCKIVHSSSVPTACYYLFMKRNEAKCAEFFAKLTTGADLKNNDPVLVLRNKALLKELKSGDMLRWFFAAWNAFQSEKNLPRNIPLTGPLPELI